MYQTHNFAHLCMDCRLYSPPQKLGIHGEKLCGWLYCVVCSTLFESCMGRIWSPCINFIVNSCLAF